MKKLVLLGALALAPILVQAQYSNYPTVIAFAGVPSGACAPNQLAVNSSNGNLYSCNSATWTAVSANPFASGGTTINVIPKSNGAGLLVDGDLTDVAATAVTSAVPIIVPASVGNITSDSIQVSGLATAGLWVAANDTTAITNTTNSWLSVGNTAAPGAQVALASGYGVSSSASLKAASSDVIWTRKGAGNWRAGFTDTNGVPVAQTISVQNAITGTDLAGSTFTIDAPLGTGAGAGASTKINRAQILATGTTSQTAANAFVVCETKILSNTSATTTTIATIGLASNSGGGVSVFHSLTATDATNFDSETQSYNVSFVNKAGVITVGTPAITTSSAANNSGSATIGATITGSSPTISLKVTPVYGTIVPTVVTLYTTIINHGAGAVTCQ